jgi:excisionase family DNA binding protein
MPEKQRFLTIAEAAEFLHVSETSLRRWTNSGKLRCFRVGGRSERRFLIEDLLAFMPGASVEPEPQVDEVETPSAAVFQSGGSVEPEPLVSESATSSVSRQRHICLFFLNKDEQWQMMRPYLVEHLRSALPVLYIQDSTPPERLLELLRAEGLPVDELVTRGLLHIIPPEAAYLLTGRFDTHRMLAFIEATILSAQAAGHERLFITGEMTWLLSNAPGAEKWKDYEVLLNPLVEKYPGVTIACQYDLSRFDGPTVLDALLTHPAVHTLSGQAAGLLSQ